MRAPSRWPTGWAGGSSPPHFFNEFTVRLDGDAAAAVERLAGAGILAGVPVSRLHPGAGLDGLLLVAVTETADAGDIEALAEALP